MDKFKQDQRVYFKVANGVEGYATIAGDYDLLVILKPETPVGPYSHIYVTKAQIIPEPKKRPTVPREALDDEQYPAGHEPYLKV